MPMMGSTESRLFLTDLARVVVAVGGDDVVVPCDSPGGKPTSRRSRRCWP